MTHDERIEAMARAIARKFFLNTQHDYVVATGRQTVDEQVEQYWHDWTGEAEFAWAAADIEGMVREAVNAGWNLGGADPDNGEITDADLDAIVARVMQGAG